VGAALAFSACVVAALLFATLRERGGTELALGPAGDEAPPQAAPSPEDAVEAVEPAADAPTFDLVRVERDGQAVIAGRAAPGSHVTIYAGNRPLAEVDADAEGNFVAIFGAGADERPRALTLQAEDARGTRTASDEVVMLLPREGAAVEEGGEADPEADASAVAARSGGGAVAGGGAPGDASAEAAEPEVAAAAVLRDGSVEVLPTDAGAGDGERRGVTLASISYSEQGEVTLAGRGTSGAALRAYVDGSLVHEAAVADDGRWAMELRDLAAGRYRLRIDQIGPDGQVASRVETPFQRDFPRPPPPRPGVPAPAEHGAGTVSVTVQPGHNLWTLARERYGSGIMDTQILTANRELIRDPDLIYPGQIFSLPDEAAE
jgi:nucleoid-associated protein YgaU